MFGDKSQGRRPSVRGNSGRRASRDVGGSVLGSHAAGPLPGGGRHSAPTGPAFANKRKSRRNRSGQIDVVMPRTSTRESSRAYSRRVAQQDLGARAVRHERIRGIGVLLAIIVVIAVVVGGASAFAYFSSVSSKMGLDDPQAKEALVAPTGDDPYYVLVAGVFAEPADAEDEADALVVARIDPANSALSLLSIPPTYAVDDSLGNSDVPISSAYASGGDAELIKQVSSIVGADIAHYVKVDADGFEKMVDALGGITVDVPEECDDPRAGSYFFPKGEQTMDGSQALAYVRSWNYSNGTTQRESNQIDVSLAIADKAIAAGTAGLPAFVDALADCIKTDLSASDITSLVNSLRSVDLSAVPMVQIPGYVQTASDGTLLFSASNSAKTSLETFRNGEAPVDEEAAKAEVSVDPSSFTVAVRNGSGITGAAAGTSDVLTGLGFQVEETGNADSQVYTETLVVYKDEGKADAAQSVVNALGFGRTTDASAYYSFDTDVLVMIGKDYTPAS